MPIPVLDAIPEIHAHAERLSKANVRSTALVCLVLAAACALPVALATPAIAATTTAMTDRMMIGLAAGTFALVCVILSMIVAALCSTDPDEACPHQDAEGQAEAAAI
jgi:hypothetical protein